jgi:3-oxoacyl-[acyl-carrier protein] reductase
MVNYNIDEKVVIVTGGERGIGKDISLGFANNGAKVVINYPIDSEYTNACEVVDEIKSRSGNAVVFKADVRNQQEIDQMVNFTIENYNRIDILVNNAGVTRDNLLIKMTEEDWKFVLDVNLTGTFNCSKRVLKEMMKNKYGKIINISSIMGLVGNAGQANYSASKGGIIAFTKSIAKEFGSRNITANAVAPGYVMTPMTDNLNEDLKKAFLNNVFIKRFGEPKDITNVVLFLASDLADYITGQVIVVDGGLTL